MVRPSYLEYTISTIVPLPNKTKKLCYNFDKHFQIHCRDCVCLLRDENAGVESLLPSCISENSGGILTGYHHTSVTTFMFVLDQLDQVRSIKLLHTA